MERLSSFIMNYMKEEAKLKHQHLISSFSYKLLDLSLTDS